MTDPVEWPTVKRQLVAILRGIRPDEAEAIVGTLIVRVIRSPPMLLSVQRGAT